MVIADGMGGHYYGEVAAQIAVQTLAESFQREATPAIDDPFMFLQKSLVNAHNAIADFTETHNLRGLAAHDLCGLPDPEQHRLLGACRRFAALPDSPLARSPVARATTRASRH